MENDLTNNQAHISKTAVITGASSGVGLATAQLFAKKGYNLILASRGLPALEKAAEECRRLGAKVIAKSTDMSIAKEVKTLVQVGLDEFGKIDIWVNNAGVMASGKFEEIPLEINEQVIKTNLMGYMLGAYYILPVFKEQKQGILINNVSIGGYMPAPYSSVYSATKFGIKGLMSGLQSEYNNEKNIHICNIYPQIQQSTGNMHSAKYSGLDFKIPPFAADPKDTAKVIYELTKKPQNDKFPGLMSYALKTIYGLFPHSISNIATTALRMMMKNDHSEATSGNILHASGEPHQIYGETSFPVPSKTSNNIISAGLAIGIGVLIWKSINHKNNKPKKSLKYAL